MEPQIQQACSYTCLFHAQCSDDEAQAAQLDQWCWKPHHHKTVNLPELHQIATVQSPLQGSPTALVHDWKEQRGVMSTWGWRSKQNSSCKSDEEKSMAFRKISNGTQLQIYMLQEYELKLKNQQHCSLLRLNTEHKTTKLKVSWHMLKLLGRCCTGLALAMNAARPPCIDHKAKHTWVRKVCNMHNQARSPSDMWNNLNQSKNLFLPTPKLTTTL